MLDVGGASGVYATWLTEQGHRVLLVDPVPRHVATARAKGVEAVVGDARALDEPDNSHDVVLLLGPLYHLIDRAERVRALAEARRVTRGLVIAAAISRWSSLWEGLLRGLVDAPDFLPMLHEGMAAWMPDITERLADPDRRAVLLDLLERTEHEPAVLSATAHLLAVAHKSA